MNFFCTKCDRRVAEGDFGLWRHEDGSLMCEDAQARAEERQPDEKLRQKAKELFEKRFFVHTDARVWTGAEMIVFADEFAEQQLAEARAQEPYVASDEEKRLVDKQLEEIRTAALRGHHRKLTDLLWIVCAELLRESLEPK